MIGTASTSLRLMLLVVSVLTMISGCYATSGRVVVGNEQGVVDVSFSDRDRWLIEDYYHRHLPPGLAKKGKLPPGLQKQLYRRGTLPPGLQGDRLPRELESRLSRLPSGVVRLRIGTDIVLSDIHTRLIFDVIKDVGR